LLRKKLRLAGLTIKPINNLPKRGYRFCEPISELKLSEKNPSNLVSKSAREESRNPLLSFNSIKAFGYLSLLLLLVYSLLSVASFKFSQQFEIGDTKNTEVVKKS
jgi:hypothetical protein